MRPCQGNKYGDGVTAMNKSDQEIPALEIGRAYTAAEAAAMLGLGKSSFNERVREGRIKPVFSEGERRFSGYVLARLLGWPLTDDPRDYVLSATAKIRGRMAETGLRVRDVAMQLGISETAVTAILNERSPLPEGFGERVHGALDRLEAAEAAAAEARQKVLAEGELREKQGQPNQ